MAKRSCSGFTLVEMAVVIVIMGLVMMTVLPALNSVRDANRISLTHTNMRSMMLATAAFVQANGCLPCPAVAGGTGTNFGKLGYASAAIACGSCPTAQGIPPFVALGVPASTAHDGWGHWITMRVDPALTNPSPAIVPPTAPCTSVDVSNGVCTAAQIGFSVKGLCKTGFDASNRIIVTMAGNGASQNAAVVFVSHGAMGYGSYVASPNIAFGTIPFPSNYVACGSNSGYARCNSASRNSRQFYEAPVVVSDNDNYDDVLAYADRNALVSMTGNGACQTTW